MDISMIVEQIQELEGVDDLHGRLTVAALVEALLEEAGLSCVVVGGTAVDLYVTGALGTSDSYPAGWSPSVDIDTIVIQARGPASTREAREVLGRAGFEQTRPGGSLLLPGIGYPVDLVGSELPDDYSEAHVHRARYEGWSSMGLPAVVLVGPEDLLFDYLESALDTRHQRDWARALAIAQAMEEHLDLSYLYSKAHWRRDGAYVGWLDKLLAGEPLELGDGLLG